MEFRILGPFEVRHAGREVPLPQGRARELLALLLLNAGVVVSNDRVIDELWGAEAPATAAKAVQNYVSQLRKALENGQRNGLLVTHGSGYVLRPEGGAVDADRFESLLRAGRAALAEGNSEAAARILSDALSIWRGDALADFAFQAFAQQEIARLEELRLETLEERIEADLTLGRHAEVVPELQLLVAANPLRERLRGQLMLALYRSGRQAEALDGYQDGRRRLVEELGLEPGRSLQELERAILAQDVALDAPPRTRPLLRRAGRGRALAAAGAALVIAAAAGVAYQLFVSNEPKGLAAISANALGLIGPDGDRIVGQVPVPGRPGPVARAGGFVWTASELNRTLTGIDEETRRVEHLVPLGISAAAVAAAGNLLWLVDEGGRFLVGVDGVYGEIVARISLPRPPPGGPVRESRATAGVAATDGTVWVTDGSARLLRIDADTGKVAAALDLGVPLDGVAVGAGAVWAASGPSATVVAVEPKSGRVTSRIPIVGRRAAGSPFPIAVAAGEGAVWTLNASTATVTKIDPQTRGIIETIPIGVARAPTGLALGPGAVWVTGSGDGTVTRIDAETGNVDVIRVGNSPRGAVVAADGVWLAVQPGEGGLARGDERVTDPAAQVTALPRESCSQVYSEGAGRPDVLIAAALPLQGFIAESTSQLSAAMRFALAERGFRAGRFSVGYQVCDDAKPQSYESSPERCAANARAFARTRRVVATVAPLFSGCTQVALPILNAAPGGPLATISFTNTYIGLTHRGATSPPDEPDRFYPSGRRNFVRVVGSDDYQAAGAAIFAQRRGAARMFVLDDGGAYGSGLAAAFRNAASALDLGVVGSRTFAGSDPSYTALADAVRSKGADGVFLAGVVQPGTTLLTDLRARLGPRAVIIGGDGLQTILKQPDRFGRSADGIFFTNPGPPPEKFGERGRRFGEAFAAEVGGEPLLHAFYAAQAIDVLLDAIERSTGSRDSVTAELLRAKVVGGIMGNFSFTPSGNTTYAAITVFEWRGAKAHLRTTVAPSADLITR